MLTYISVSFFCRIGTITEIRHTPSRPAFQGHSRSSELADFERLPVISY